MRKLIGLIAKEAKDVLWGIQSIYRLCRPLLPVTVVNAILKAVFPFINLYVSALIMNGLLEGENLDYIIRLIVVTVLISLITYLLTQWLNLYHARLMRVMMYNRNMRINEKIMSMEYSLVESPETHTLRSKIQEAENMNGGGTSLLVREIEKFAQSIFTIGIALFMVSSLFSLGQGHSLINIVVSSVFALVLFGGVVLNIVCLSALNSKSFKLYGKIMSVNRIFGFFYGHIVDYNVGKGVRLYNQRPIIMDSISKFNNDTKILFNDMGNEFSKFQGLSSLISGVSVGAVYLFVAFKSYMKAIPLGSVLKYIGSISQLTTGLTDIMTSGHAIINNNKYLRLYKEFLELKSEIHKGSIPIKADRSSDYQISFNDVSFKYPGTEEYVLRNLTMDLKIGERLAIVGMNGSGKTTLVKLLCRLYDVNEGNITLNGRDIKEYNYEDYLKLFSVVFQDFSVFSFTLGQNVATSTSYDLERVRHELERVGFMEKLEKMEKGLDTYLYKHFDPMGVEVSGGEGQKIALARALYRESPIVILDEPTSALDPIAEHEIYKRFNDIIKTRTAFYISHRLSSCRFCDNIAVFHEGRLIQRGKHEELLLDREGKYHELWHAQANYYNDEALASLA